MSNALLLTAHLKEGAKIQLHALNQSKLPAGLPSLRQVQEARTVRVRELNAGLNKKISSAEKGKRRDWLPLLIREALGMHFVIHFVPVFMNTISRLEISHAYPKDRCRI